MTVAVLLEDASLVGPALRWPLRLAVEAGRDLVLVVPGDESATSVVTTALEPDSKASPAAAEIAGRLRAALDATLGGDAWAPRQGGERPAIRGNAADERSAAGPIEVQLRVVPPDKAVEETKAQLGDADSDLLVVVLASAVQADQESLRRVVVESYCEAAFVIPGSRQADGEVLTTLSKGQHARAGARVAHRLAKTHARALTALWVEPDVGPDASRVARRLLSRMLDESLEADAAGVALRVEVDDKPVRGILRVCEDERYELLVMGASRLSVRGVLGAGIASRVARASDAPTVVAVRATVPRPLRAMTWLEFQLRRIVPQLQREERTELVARIQSQSQWNFDFVLMMGLSTLIAGLGLLDDNVAVIIGAMLVAPLMTPLLGIGMALAQSNPLLITMTLRTTLLGFLTAFGLAFLLGLATPGFFEPTPEMYARDWPRMLDLAIAFVSGLAAAYASGRPGLLAALPGVAIAAALLPPVAVSGLALALGQTQLVLGSLLLFGVNMVAIVFASGVALWAVGLHSVRKSALRTRVVGVGLTVAALAMVLGILVAPPPSTPPRELVEAVEKVLGRNYRLRDMRVRNEPSGPVVQIDLGGSAPPDQELADQLDEATRSRLGEPARVRMTYRHETELGAGRPAAPGSGLKPGVPRETGP